MELGVELELDNIASVLIHHYNFINFITSLILTFILCFIHILI